MDRTLHLLATGGASSLPRLPEGPGLLRSSPAAILAPSFRLSVPVASDLPSVTPGLPLRLSTISADSRIRPLLQWPRLHITIPDFASWPSPTAPSQMAVPDSASAHPGLSQPPPSALLRLLPGLLRTRLSPSALDGHPDNPARPRLYAPCSQLAPDSSIPSSPPSGTRAKQLHLNLLRLPQRTQPDHARFVLGFPSVMLDPKIELDAPGFVPSLKGLSEPPLSSFRPDPTPPTASGSGLHPRSQPLPALSRFSPNSRFRFGLLRVQRPSRGLPFCSRGRDSFTAWLHDFNVTLDSFMGLHARFQHPVVPGDHPFYMYKIFQNSEWGRNINIYCHVRT